jgi:hypothetical protein
MHEARRLADEPVTLETLADEFGVSRERVRMIEVRAFENTRRFNIGLPPWSGPNPPGSRSSMRFRCGSVIL